MCWNLCGLKLLISVEACIKSYMLYDIFSALVTLDRHNMHICMVFGGKLINRFLIAGFADERA